VDRHHAPQPGTMGRKESVYGGSLAGMCTSHQFFGLEINRHGVSLGAAE
jgi:hypothetical protein